MNGKHVCLLGHFVLLLPADTERCLVFCVVPKLVKLNTLEHAALESNAEQIEADHS